jgi:hypothetical protein
MAYQFNGTNQYLSIEDNANLDVTGALTIRCIAKPNATISGEGYFFGKWTGATNQRSYGLGIYQNKIYGIITSLGTSASAVDVQGSALIGTSQNDSAMVFTPSTSLEVFLNGSSQATNTTSIPASIFNSTSPLTISFMPTVYFPGLIAEVGIWNAALTAAEIASLAKGMTCDKVRPQSLVFYAPLVRDLQDVRGGLTITNNNAATVATHPRVYA